jgi:hypothetical protein
VYCYDREIKQATAVWECTYNEGGKEYINKAFVGGTPWKTTLSRQKKRQEARCRVNMDVRRCGEVDETGSGSVLDLRVLLPER